MVLNIRPRPDRRRVRPGLELRAAACTDTGVKRPGADHNREQALQLDRVSQIATSITAHIGPRRDRETSPSTNPQKSHERARGAAASGTEQPSWRAPTTDPAGPLRTQPATARRSRDTRPEMRAGRGPRLAAHLPFADCTSRLHAVAKRVVGEAGELMIEFVGKRSSGVRSAEHSSVADAMARQCSTPRSKRSYGGAADRERWDGFRLMTASPGWSGETLRLSALRWSRASGPRAKPARARAGRRRPRRAQGRSGGQCARHPRSRPTVCVEAMREAAAT